MLQWVVRAGVFVLATTVLSNAQGKTETGPPSPKVALSLTQSVYKAGEPVEATVTLENVGSNSLYVPKHLGGGYDDLGFRVYIVRNGEPYCIVEGSFVCGKVKRRSVEQLLKDDFLLLPSGGLIGLHVRLRTSCVRTGVIPPLPPGTYEIAAEYAGSGGCLPDLNNKPTQFPIVQSRVKAVRTHFELTE